jgi:hypothetical protein
VGRAIYVPVADPFYGEHDARLQPGWSTECGKGQVSVFDDEYQQPGPARGVVYDVTVGPGDGGTGDCGAPVEAGAAVAWQRKGSVSSLYMGSMRILPDGSRIIGWGTGGAPGLVFTEVNRAGDALLELYFADNNISYRAIKVPLTELDLGIMRATAGQ